MPANVFMLFSFMGVLKSSGMMDMTSGLMATYDANVSLGRIEKLENMLEASESDKSNEQRAPTKSEKYPK